MEFRVRFNPTSQRIPVRFQAVQEVTGEPPDVEIYTGSYEVIPKVETQTLPTAQRFLTEDVKVTKIPYYVTGNTSGGDTVYIAKEVD